MHLFRTAPLVRQLARNELSNTKKAHYLLASFLMFTVIYYSGIVGGSPLWSVASFFEAAAIVLITIVGIVKCFDAAGGEDSSEFIATFTCLYVPVTITTMLVIWSLFWAVTLGFRESLMAISHSRMQFALNLSRLGTDLFGFLNFAAAVAVQLVTFYRMTGALAEVRIARSDS